MDEIQKSIPCFVHAGTSTAVILQQQLTTALVGVPGYYRQMPLNALTFIF